MTYCKLRIAFSTTCGIVCLLLIALWVRSWSRLDRFDAPIGRLLPGSTIAVASVRGVLMVGIQQKLHAAYPDPRLAWRVSSGPIDQAAIEHLKPGSFGFKVIRSKRENGIQLPYWFVAAVPATCAAMPWIRWSRRFSLRTLLIAATLVAVSLGLIVARSR
jgi:hypothetical protein